MKIRKSSALILAAALAAPFLTHDTAFAAAVSSYDIGLNVGVYASGMYVNWDGVTNVAQFAGPDGEFCYAVNSEDEVTVYKTQKGVPVSGSVVLEKKHPLFGTVVCDSNGYYYLVTGEMNEGDDTTVETIFISKYDSSGNHIKTVGDNGSSSLSWVYDSEFYTQLPFKGGCCDAAISNGVLTVDYARQMYSKHQSNSVFSVKTSDLTKVSTGPFYQSHSFAQRVVSTENGFVYVNEGDCYGRAFELYCADLTNNTYLTVPIFDFFVQDGALEQYNMWILNDNFAHMGGLAALPDGRVAFVAQSVRSLSADAENEKEDVFIQIFDLEKNLYTPEAYTTSGERSGLAGPNGRTQVTNYGVKWLTACDENTEISDVQIAAVKDKIVVLYEKTVNNTYKGVFYIVLDSSGNVLASEALFSEDALLNSCEMPVTDGGVICWAGNRYRDYDNVLYTYTLDIAAKGHLLVKTDAVPAGCESEGVKEHYSCSDCGKLFADPYAKTEVKEAELVIPALGHDWGIWVEIKAPTEQEEGIMQRVCRRDATHAQQLPIEKLEPDLDDPQEPDTDPDPVLTPPDETDEERAERVFGILESTKSDKVKRYGRGSIAVRSDGSSRFDTAIETADDLKIALGSEKFDAIIIASSHSYPDALSGSFLAAKKNAPILVVRNNEKQDGLDKAVEYIRENLSEKGRVYILGGAAAVSETAENAIKQAAAKVIRLAGEDRYGTNRAILSEARIEDGDELLIADAKNFADALSASALGKPILLINKNKGLSNEQKAFLYGRNIACVYLLGGESAVPDSIRNDLAQILPQVPVTRIGGSTRYETSVKIARTFFADPGVITLATGTNFPDGLTGGPLAYALGAPLILTREKDVLTSAQYAADSGTARFVVFGGESAVPESVVRKIAPQAVITWYDFIS